MPLRRWIVVGVCGLLVSAGLEAGPGRDSLGEGAQELTRGESDKMAAKLNAILERGNLAPPKASTKAPATPAPLRTSFTEREVNAFFKFGAQSAMPVGLVNPRITILDNGLLQGRATVDLDAVRKQKPRGLTDPLAWVSGSADMLVSGFFKSANGKGTFEYQAGAIGGVPIPKSVLQEIVVHYTRSPELPKGFNLDEPFELPHSIREILTQRGAATIVQ